MQSKDFIYQTGQRCGLCCVVFVVFEEDNEREGTIKCVKMMRWSGAIDYFDRHLRA